MQQLNRRNFRYPSLPERVVQFGEGNFLRCFIDWQIDLLNEQNNLGAGIVVVRPIDTEQPPSLNTQDGLYTTLLRGYDDEDKLRNERRIISSVQREVAVYEDYREFLSIARNPELRFVVSNTTEAGIAYNDQDGFGDAPPSSFPAKLTRFLYERFGAFAGSSEKGLVLLPCELIDYNGEQLREIVLQYAELWHLPAGFRAWILEANTFCSTLVDRIVTGHPWDEIEQLESEQGYRDDFLVTGEFFHLFIIQGPAWVGEELKLSGSELNIKIVDDLMPYKLRKVGILNGCHTAMTPVAHLCGIDLVNEATSDPQIERFLARLLDEEIIPSLPLPPDELKSFSDAVMGRFKNPFIKHKLLDISLNSMTKFKTRLLPQLLQSAESRGSAPPLLTLSLAALICFYRGEIDGRTYPLKDDQPFLDLYSELWGSVGHGPADLPAAREIARRILGLEQHWDIDLLKINGLLEQTATQIVSITNNGMRQTLQEVL
jgi:tagaturonate reductase